MGRQPWEVINDPDLYRENSNINQFIVIPLSMLDAVDGKMQAIRAGLEKKYTGVPYRGRDWRPRDTPMAQLLPSLSGWSRGEGMKGSEQTTRSFMGAPQQEGVGQAPNLTPPRPNTPQAVAVVAYKGAKDLQRDIRRKRWGI